MNILREVACIEFNTNVKPTLLTNYTDLISAGVWHNCGYKTYGGIKVGLDMCMIRLLYNTFRTVYLQTEVSQPAALLHSQDLRQELVQPCYCGCGQQLR
jgi:hypothetical protein